MPRPQRFRLYLSISSLAGTIDRVNSSFTDSFSENETQTDSGDLIFLPAWSICFQLEARKKVARLVLSFVVVFVVCWLPRHIWYFWYHFDPGHYNMFWHVFKIVAFCLSYINSCINPLALYFLSRQFRRYYNRYLCCCCSYCFRTGSHGAHPADGQCSATDRRIHLVIRNRHPGDVNTGGADALRGETSQMTRLNSAAAVAALGSVAQRNRKQNATSMTMLTTMAC